MAEFEEIARAAVERIVSSAARHRLVVAGPGTGKTHLFGRVLEGARDRDRQVVLTFINNLKNDLDRSLGHAARVFTFHGYCHHLLRTSPETRQGLSGDFHYYPAIVRLVDEDWTIGAGRASARFVRLMRNAQIGDEMDFYLARSNYYDSIGFDDSVFRVYVRLKEEAALIRDYDLVLVDEYQDFNRLEAELIGLIRSVSRTLIAGDDDQALYSLLREAKAQFIRDLHIGDHYENFELPFCMRSTQVIVEAVGDVVSAARGRGKLAGRIDKPYQYYPPKKAADSERYPRIKLVKSTVQSGKVNYFGRYIEREIVKISSEEIQESNEANCPTVLIIGPGHYLRQIHQYLEERGLRCRVKEDSGVMDVDRAEGLQMIRADARQNLGWRVVLYVDRPEGMEEWIRESVASGAPLCELVSEAYRTQILGEVLSGPDEEIVEAVADRDEREGEAAPSIVLTTFEGSKGLAAQHVFIVGLQNGDLPRNAARIEDLEICRFIVALTRTRKQCHLMYADRWNGVVKQPSELLRWIGRGRLDLVKVNKDYWDRP